jgi:hypothetical protein
MARVAQQVDLQQIYVGHPSVIPISWAFWEMIRILSRMQALYLAAQQLVHPGQRRLPQRGGLCFGQPAPPRFTSPPPF